MIMIFNSDTEYIHTCLGLNKSPHKDFSLSPTLHEIKEESERLTETKHSIRFKSQISIKQEIEESYTEENKQISPFFKSFLEILKNHPSIFPEFVKLAQSSNVLQSSKQKKFVSKSEVKRISVTPKLNKIYADEDSIISDFKTPNRVFRKGFIYPNPYYMKRKKISASIFRESDETSSQTSSSVSTNGNLFGRFRSGRDGLHASNSRLKEIFHEITKGRPKMQKEDFKVFLSKRYNRVISESISNFFDFRLGSLSDYINEFNKLINASEFKQLEFCFNLLDFNKDKMICYKDAFQALEFRTGNFYDNDLALIIEMFSLKKDGRLSFMKSRRKSTMSILESKVSKRRKGIFMFLKTETAAIGSNVFLSFPEFCHIKFIGRPQLFLDILDYTTGYNFLKEKGLVKNIPSVPSRGSEYLIDQMRLNEDFCRKILKNEKYDYYIKLESALEQLTKTQSEDLLKKFKHLQHEEKLKYKIISKSSMIQKLVFFRQPGLLGFNNLYFSERVYEYFSDGQDLTKPVFLNKISELLKENKEAVASKIAFEIFDSRKDGILTVDEVHNMFEVFPVSSPAYNECFKLISLFVLSIYERLRQKLKGVTYKKFVELVPVSIIGLEILNFISLPFSQSLNRQSEIFKPLSIDDNALSQHYNARSSLLKILD